MKQITALLFAFLRSTNFLMDEVFCILSRDSLRILYQERAIENKALSSRNQQKARRFFMLTRISTAIREARWTPNRVYALMVGIFFLVLAIFSWIFAPSGPLLFGIFRTAVTRNIIISITAILALWAAYRGTEASRLFNLVFGIVYLLWGILSFIPGFNNGGVLFNFIHYNSVDNIMEIILGIIGIYMSLYVSRYIEQHNEPHGERV